MNIVCIGGGPAGALFRVADETTEPKEPCSGGGT